MTKFAFIMISLMPLWAGIVAVIFWFTIGRRLADRERAAREHSIQQRNGNGATASNLGKQIL
jgi:hypothetical protein